MACSSLNDTLRGGWHSTSCGRRESDTSQSQLHSSAPRPHRRKPEGTRPHHLALRRTSTTKTTAPLRRAMLRRCQLFSETYATKCRRRSRDSAHKSSFAQVPWASISNDLPHVRAAQAAARATKLGTTPTRPARAHIWGRWSARSWRSQRGRAGWGIRQTITNAVKDILAGNVGALAAKVEAVLARTVLVRAVHR